MEKKLKSKLLCKYVGFLVLIVHTSLSFFFSVASLFCLYMTPFVYTSVCFPLALRVSCLRVRGFAPSAFVCCRSTRDPIFRTLYNNNMEGLDSSP